MPKIKEPEATYIVDRKGKKKAVVLSIEVYEKLIEDLDDLTVIASRKDEARVSWEHVKKRLKRNGHI